MTDGYHRLRAQQHKRRSKARQLLRQHGFLRIERRNDGTAAGVAPDGKFVVIDALHSLERDNQVQRIKRDGVHGFILTEARS